MGKAKTWYSQTIGSVQGDWETLWPKFCLRFFPISKVVSLRKEVLNFRQLEEESLGTSWERINSLITTGPDLAISNPMLLQHCYMGLSKDSAQSVDAASRGAFLCLSISKARTILDRIIGKTPCTNILVELSEEKKESSPKQRRGSFESQITTTLISRFSYQSRTFNTPKSSKGRRNSTFGIPY